MPVKKTRRNRPTVGTFLCNHCGNKAVHELVEHQDPLQVFDYFDEGDPMLVPYDYFILSCTTCAAPSVRGGFRSGTTRATPTPTMYPALFPAGADFSPAPHTLVGGKAIPDEVMRVYRKAWPLRHTAPSAFANQVRRALEFVCKDKKAKGSSLHEQLKDLASRGIFRAEIADLAELIRDVGNRGSHAGDRELDIWDAELLDELFRVVLRSVYLAPSHAARMRQRLSV